MRIVSKLVETFGARFHPGYSIQNARELARGFTCRNCGGGNCHNNFCPKCCDPELMAASPTSQGVNTESQPQERVRTAWKDGSRIIKLPRECSG
jgi:hypothetical protein